MRTATDVELLILTKRTFFELDRATLNIISENARYNAACTKAPGQRTRSDLQILQQRTAHLGAMSSFSSDIFAPDSPPVKALMKMASDVNLNALKVMGCAPLQCIMDD